MVGRLGLPSVVGRAAQMGSMMAVHWALRWVDLWEYQRAASMVGLMGTGLAVKLAFYLDCMSAAK